MDMGVSFSTGERDLALRTPANNGHNGTNHVQMRTALAAQPLGP